MKLYYMETPNPRRACAVAGYLHCTVDLVRVDLRKGENKSADFLAINPNGKVPALVDGETRLWEADAIMCYLADQAGSELWPRDARQIDIIRWFSWNAYHFSRHGGTLFFEHVVRPAFGLGPVDAAALEEATAQFRRFAAVLDAHLDGRTYLVGDRLSVADFSVSSLLPYTEAARLPLEGFTHIRRWHDRLSMIDAWREPFPVMASAA